jgi:hypothetical protein
MSALTKSSSPTGAAMLPMSDRTVSLPVTTPFKDQAEPGWRHCSDTAGTLYDSTVSIGTDIVANSGACLASNLQVQVLQGIEVQNLEIIDTTCTDVNDITLLDSFGALTSLIHLRRRKRRASQLFC